MRQRVAIARALVCRPILLLMDEPSGSLDAQTREDLEDLEDLLLEVHRTDATTVVFVTHDIDESACDVPRWGGRSVRRSPDA